MGTPKSMLQTANFIELMESRQDLKIACVEEVAYRMGYIDAAQLEWLARPACQNGYGQYLLRVLQQR
jgi:glucose-1-phosphate thymidylyltransferase